MILQHLFNITAEKGVSLTSDTHLSKSVIVKNEGNYGAIFLQ